MIFRAGVTSAAAPKIDLSYDKIGKNKVFTAGAENSFHQKTYLNQGAMVRWSSG